MQTEPKAIAVEESAAPGDAQSEPAIGAGGNHSEQKADSSVWPVLNFLFDSFILNSTVCN